MRRLKWFTAATAAGWLSCGAGAQLGSPLVGDCNLDGVVDMDDAAIVSANFGKAYTDKCSTGQYATVLDGDVNRDGVVNFFDLLTVLSAQSDSLGAVPTIAGVDISSSYNSTTKKIEAYDDTLVMGENAAPILLLDPNGTIPVWQAYTGYDCLEPSITLEPKDDGFDIVAHYDNTSGTQAYLLGRLYVPNIKMNATVGVRHFLAESTEYERTWNSPGGGLTPNTHAYPDDKYSPIEIVRGTISHAGGSNEYTVGASLLYPLLVYQHGVHIYTEARSSRWHIRYDLNPPMANGNSNPVYNAAADIQPGEERTYRIAVRFMRTSTWTGTHDNDWLHLVLDYRRYFRALYGTCEYTRDVRPMVAFNVAAVSNCNIDPMHPGYNPYGFTNGNRADLNGWGDWITAMENAEDDGFKRFMLRKPSGVFCPDDPDHLNLPFQMTTNWWEIAGNDPNEPILDTLEDIATFIGDDSTRRLGLWWGRASQVMTAWPSTTASILDFCNSSHVAAAYAELDGALVPGAQEIGLDAFSHMPAWDRYFWIQHMRQDGEYDFRFIQEPNASDILHVRAPSFTRGMYNNVNTARWIRGPHALADMLVPGHESHAMVESVSSHNNAAAWRAISRDFASYGFVPHVFSYPGDLTEGSTVSLTDYNAAQSWLTTVPSGILSSR